MDKQKYKKLFDIAEEFYSEQQERSGMTDPIPYAWVEHEKLKEVVIISPFPKHNKKIMSMLEDYNWMVDEENRQSRTCVFCQERSKEFEEITMAMESRAGPTICMKLSFCSDPECQAKASMLDQSRFVNKQEGD